MSWKFSSGWAGTSALSLFVSPSLPPRQSLASLPASPWLAGIAQDFKHYIHELHVP